MSDDGTPRDLYALPYAKRRAMERAISAYLRPDNPRNVSIAEGQAFLATQEWPRLYAAVNEAFWPRARLTGADIEELFRISGDDPVRIVDCHSLHDLATEVERAAREAGDG